MSAKTPRPPMYTSVRVKGRRCSAIGFTLHPGHMKQLNFKLTVANTTGSLASDDFAVCDDKIFVKEIIPERDGPAGEIPFRFKKSESYAIELQDAFGERVAYALH